MIGIKPPGPVPCKAALQQSPELPTMPMDERTSRPVPEIRDAADTTGVTPGVTSPPAVEPLSDVALTLKQLRCFTGCGVRELNAIARFTGERDVAPRQLLFARGDACSYLFALVYGSVKLTRGSNDSEAVVDLVGPGHLFGELALFSGAGHASTAVTLSRCRVLTISAVPMLRHLQSSPRTACALLTHMGQRIGGLLDRVERNTLYSAEQITAAHLLDRSDDDGVLEPATAGCGRRTLGSFLGLRPETLSRVLSRFRREGWLRDLPDGRQAVDRDALAARLPRDE